RRSYDFAARAAVPPGAGKSAFENRREALVVIVEVDHAPLRPGGRALRRRARRPLLRAGRTVRPGLRRGGGTRRRLPTRLRLRGRLVDRLIEAHLVGRGCGVGLLALALELLDRDAERLGLRLQHLLGDACAHAAHVRLDQLGLLTGRAGDRALQRRHDGGRQRAGLLAQRLLAQFDVLDRATG